MDVEFGSTMYSLSSTLTSNEIGSAFDSFVDGKEAKLGAPLKCSIAGVLPDESELWRDRSTVLVPLKVKSKYTPSLF